MICGGCRKSTPYTDIRYVMRGKETPVALCIACRGMRNVKPSSIKEAPQAPERVPYICDRCKYSFRFKADGTYNLKCPYCGKSDKIRRKTVISADDIIKSSIE